MSKFRTTDKQLKHALCILYLEYYIHIALIGLCYAFIYPGYIFSYQIKVSFCLNDYVKLIKHPLNAFPSTIPFPNYYYLLTDSFVLLFTGNYDQMNLQHACM